MRDDNIIYGCISCLFTFSKVFLPLPRINNYFLNCKSDEDARKMYRKLCKRFYPNNKNINDKTIFYDIQSQYKAYKTNEMCYERMPKPFCTVKNTEVNNTICQCGSTYNINDLDDNLIHCEACSLYIFVEINIYDS